MPFFIVRNYDDEYLTNRKPTGRTYPQVYQARSGWSDDIGQAKVFTTKGAATTSGKSNGECDFKIIRVEIELKEIVSTFVYDDDEE